MQPTKAAIIKTVLIFDSGAGGLTVAREVIELDLNIHLHYLADNAFFPYGKKPDQQLVNRVVDVLSKAIPKIKPDIIIIACNTASTLALEELRAHFKDIEFIGVVPAIKPAVALSKSGHIGILATAATVNRPYTRNLINNFAPQQQVYLHGSEALVEMAEASLAQTFNQIPELEKELALLLEQSPSMDVIVLACTHFPLLKKQLQACAKKLNAPVSFIDSGTAIARRVQQLLTSQNSEAEFSERVEKEVKVELTTTSDPDNTAKKYFDFLNADH